MAVSCTPPEPEKQYTSIEGDILPFTTEVAGKRVSGAKVTILERPDLSFTTGEDAHFVFDGIAVGTDVTLVVEAAGFKSTQTATLKVGPKGIHPFPIQVVSNELYELLAALMPLAPQEDRFCAIATTAARFGGGLYVALRQGMPGVQVLLEPAARPESGPIYFNDDVIPDKNQPSTSIDGGVLYYRVPPGDYVMRASKAGAVFSEVRFKCRAGYVVNAGPPLGVMAHVKSPDHSLGVERAADEYSEVTDALCEKTAVCVNEREMSENYKAATIVSCKQHFRNTWAFVDEACAASSLIKEKAKATYECRTASCADNLGEDVCPDQEAAFRAAEEVYAACIASR
ncbi:MAG: hypothetical protein DI536_08320 [Archangium gephyra]|uniref:Carboxypeptidase regulatory-like domain-containing protein n=1 Tax=Archangium gephyra TaxID=48 RepID=A0A2W5TVM6_9BACT|nr:MAG: hypothetical protein DI536_08320 [Archangium gephyra]